MTIKSTADELESDIIHLVNVLVGKARDGEYVSDNAKCQALYRKFKKLLAELKGK